MHEFLVALVEGLGDVYPDTWRGCAVQATLFIVAFVAAIFIWPR